MHHTDGLVHSQHGGVSGVATPQHAAAMAPASSHTIQGIYRAPPVEDPLSNILPLAAGGAGAEADGGRGRAHLPHHRHWGTHFSGHLPPTSCVYLLLCLVKSEVEMHQAVLVIDAQALRNLDPFLMLVRFHT